MRVFYSSVFSKEDRTGRLPEFRKRTEEVLNNLNITEKVVQEYLEKLDPYKSQGADGINPFFLKQCARYGFALVADLLQVFRRW